MSLDYRIQMNATCPRNEKAQPRSGGPRASLGGSGAPGELFCFCIDLHFLTYFYI